MNHSTPYYAPSAHPDDIPNPLEAAVAIGAVRLQAAVHGAYHGFVLPPAVLPEIRTVGYWDASSDQHWGRSWHRHEGIEFTYLHSGRLGIEVLDQPYELHPGQMTITRPWQRHRVGLPEVSASRLTWLVLDVGARRPNQEWKWPRWVMLTQDEKMRLADFLRHNEQPVWSSNRRIEAAFHRLAKVAETARTEFDQTEALLSVNELLLAVLRHLDQLQPAGDISLTSSYRSVELFLANLPQQVGHFWTVETMAEACGVKRSRFTSLCREITNRAPAEYLAHCRVDAACGLLREKTDMSVTDVANACGFGTSQYFATVFRSLRGCSPLAWRQKLAK